METRKGDEQKYPQINKGLQSSEKRKEQNSSMGLRRAAKFLTRVAGSQLKHFVFICWVIKIIDVCNNGHVD